MYGAALHVLKAEKFPILELGKPRTTVHQIAFSCTDVDDGPSTKMTLLGLSQHSDFDRLFCEHEEIRRIDARWRKEHIQSLTIKFTFELFRHHSKPSLLIARGNRKIVNAAMKRLKAPDMVVAYDPVDVQGLFKALHQKRVTTMHAAYFSDLKVEKVKAAALYGEDVDQSDEYSHLDLAGVLSGIMIETPVAGAITKFLVTNKRTIVVYHQFEERDLLDFGLAVNDLIEDALPPPKGQRAA